jgi:hypothetical protein
LRQQWVCWIQMGFRPAASDYGDSLLISAGKITVTVY